LARLCHCLTQLGTARQPSYLFQKHLPCWDWVYSFSQYGYFCNIEEKLEVCAQFFPCYCCPSLSPYKQLTSNVVILVPKQCYFCHCITVLNTLSFKLLICPLIKDFEFFNGKDGKNLINALRLNTQSFFLFLF